MIPGETKGGWDSIMNVVNAPPAANLVSGFFPFPQRDKIRSAVMISRGPAGATHRKVRYEMQSILESHRFRARGWKGTPYAPELSVPTVRRESRMLADLVAAKAPPIRKVTL